jgi:ubiquitin-activating enzyme E1 C
MCTIAETPRLPEHCIAYAFTVEWERTFPNKTLDKDSPEDMNWVYQQALARANKHGIQGVTYFKTIGVVKNIIPAVASTNAIIAGMCVSEAVKILTFCSQTMNTYCMYMGSQGIYSYTFEYLRKDNCIVCSDAADTKSLTLSAGMTLQEFIELLQQDAQFQLKKPSITSDTNSLYMQNPPSLEKALRHNLDKPLGELIENDDILTVTDPMLFEISLSIQIHFS